jgi:DNA modification methylase
LKAMALDLEVGRAAHFQDEDVTPLQSLAGDDTSLLNAARDCVAEIESRFSDIMEINRDFSRSIVSFQANKSEAYYRWFKYREGFSKPLVEYLIDHSEIAQTGHVLDPFAGTGATCFVANERGISATAIELLPVGSHFIRLRQAITGVAPSEISAWLHEVVSSRPWESIDGEVAFSHLRITQDAFSPETETALARYRFWVSQQPQPKQYFCDFLSYSILEEISFTRKDGQYLRWDHRSPRSKVRGKFEKGRIYSFEEAIVAKARSILADLDSGSADIFSNLTPIKAVSDISLFEGSNFQALEQVDASSVDLIITSPPYCNRYDYTRTYALELAYLCCSEDRIRNLRQALLSCTVENRPKDLQGIVSDAAIAKGVAAFKANDAIQASVAFLEGESKARKLNNPGIVKMVRGYFKEMAIHIAQLARVMKPGGRIYMVNDNVRYNGLDVPVDCILSAFAEDLGFRCLKIWVLPMGKGNSSQQMKLHGRSELRKCVYIWERLSS